MIRCWRWCGGVVPKPAGALRTTVTMQRGLLDQVGPLAAALGDVVREDGRAIVKPVKAGLNSLTPASRRSSWRFRARMVGRSVAVSAENAKLFARRRKLGPVVTGWVRTRGRGRHWPEWEPTHKADRFESTWDGIGLALDKAIVAALIRRVKVLRAKR